MQAGATITGERIAAFGRRMQKSNYGTSGSKKSNHSGQEQRLCGGALATVRHNRAITLILDEPRRMMEAVTQAPPPLTDEAAAVTAETVIDEPEQA